MVSLTTNYPGFGEVIDPSPKSTRVKIIKEVAAGVVFVAAVVGIAALASSSLGIGLVAGGIAVGIVVISKIAIEVFRKYYAHSYELKLPIEKQNRSTIEDSSQLGAYSKANLKLVDQSSEIFEWKKKLIQSATSSIEISVNYGGGEALNEILGLIDKQMEQHPDLKTHIIVSEDLLTKENKKILKLLAEKYQARFNYLITDRIIRTEPYLLSEENHVKLLIIDGKYFMMGSSGIEKQMVREEAPSKENHQGTFVSKLLTDAFKETDIVGSGVSIAETMRQQFFDLYSIWEYRMSEKKEDRFFACNSQGICSSFEEDEQMIKDCSIKFIVSSPAHRHKNPISKEIAQLIRNVKTDIRIGNLFFNPDKIVKEALKAKKLEGVPIIGHLNGWQKSFHPGTPLIVWPSRANYNLLSEVYEYERKGCTYHTKMLALGEEHTVIGSYNFSVQSSTCAYESVCVIQNPDFTNLVKQSLDKDKKHAIHFKEDKLKSKYKLFKLPGLFISEVAGTFCA